MQFDFYIVVAGEQSICQIRLLDNAHLETTPENAIEEVNKRFQELISNDPDILSMVVVSPSFGDFPGRIIAAELVHAWPVDVRQRQGKPKRELIWVVDGKSTNLKNAPNLS